jgi:hypothetical protein
VDSYLTKIRSGWERGRGNNGSELTGTPVHRSNEPIDIDSISARTAQKLTPVEMA